MKTISLLLVLLTSNIMAEEIQIKELDSGASRDIAYKISKNMKIDGVLYLQLCNRYNYDIRLKYTIIPGVGDAGRAEVSRTAIIPKNGVWPMAGSGAIKADMKSPGIRIGEIEKGIIIEEEGVYYDSEGNETYSKVYKFKPDPDVNK